MIKKILSSLLVIILLKGCGFTPIYSSNNKVTLNIKEINFVGDWETNNFINNGLKRYSNNETGKEYKLLVESNYSKRATNKNSAGNITSYEGEIIVKMNLISDDTDDNFLFKENFIMENYTDELEEKNYETSNKRNLVNIIINKFMIKLSFQK